MAINLNIGLKLTNVKRRLVRANNIIKKPIRSNGSSIGERRSVKCDQKEKLPKMVINNDMSNVTFQSAIDDFIWTILYQV